MRKNPKSLKILSSCYYLFVLLGSARVEAGRKMLMKLIPGRRAPSVAGSDTGYRPGSRGFQPTRPVMLNNESAVANVPRKPGPGSVTTSIEGRLASGRRVSQLQQQQQRFITRCPFHQHFTTSFFV